MKFVLNLQMLRRINLRIRFILNRLFLIMQLVHTLRIPHVQWIMGVILLRLKVSYLDLSVRTGGLNTSQVYSGSDKIYVKCVSISGKIQAGDFGGNLQASAMAGGRQGKSQVATAIELSLIHI